MRLAQGSMTTKLFGVVLSAILLFGCMKSPEQQYADYMESGQTYVEAGDHTSAALQFRNAARTNPDQAEPQYQLAKSYLELGRIRECFLAAREAVTIDPDHTDAALLMAQILARIGNQQQVEEAEGMLQNVLGDRPEDAEALFALALTRARLGSREDAEASLELALQNAPDHLQSAVTLARMRASEGDRETAEEILRTALAESEDPRPARLALAQYLLFDERLPEATAEIEGILDDEELYLPALLARGLLHLRAGEADLAEAVYKRVAEAPDTTQPTAYARVLAVNGKMEEATAEFQRLFDADPDNRELRALVVVSMLREGRIDDAEEILSAAIEENEQDFDARLQRSEIYLRSNRNDLARADVDVALQVQGTNAKAHYLLAKIHQATGNPTGGRQELGESLRLENDFLLARLDMAQSLLRSVSRRSALDVLDEAPAEQQDNPRLVSGRIWALVALGDYSDALAEVASARERLGELRDLRLQEGVIYAAQGDHSKAEPLLQASLEASPGDLRAYNALVASQMGGGRAEEGLATARRHADAYPSVGALQLAAGTWFARAGRTSDARTYLERASALGDATLQAELLLARLDESDRRDAQAMSRLEAIIEKQSTHVVALVRLASLQERNQRLEEAEANYRSAIVIAPENVTALNNLAYLVASNNGDLAEAVTLAQRAREHSPDGYPGTALIDDTLGWIHYLRGSYPAAVLSLTAAAEGAPKMALIQYHLAMAHAKNGNLDTAQLAYDAGVALDPNIPEAAQAAELLR